MSFIKEVVVDQHSVAFFIDCDQQNVRTRLRKLHAHDLWVAIHRHFPDDVPPWVENGDQSVVANFLLERPTLILEVSHINVPLVMSRNGCRSESAAHLTENTGDFWLPEHRKTSPYQVKPQYSVLAGLANVEDFVILSQSQSRRVGQAI